MEEEGQLNDMFEVVKTARPNKRAKPASSSGQTRKERLHDLERYLFEKSGEIAVRDCCHTGLKSYFCVVYVSAPQCQLVERGWGIPSVQPFETGAKLYKGILLWRSFSYPWLRVCDLVFKHEDEVAAATGKTMFEKLQAPGTKEPKIAFSALVDVAKNIRATELAPEGLGPESDLALKARICLMIFWIYEGVRACCAESIQRGEHSVAFQKLSLDGALGNWSRTVDQLVEHGLPSVIGSDKLAQLEKESPFEFGVAGESI